MWRRRNRSAGTHQSSLCATVLLNVDGPGQYRVALTYHWYATKSVPEHEEYYWASAHFGEDQYEVPDHKWCNFAT